MGFLERNGRNISKTWKHYFELESHRTGTGLSLDTFSGTGCARNLTRFGRAMKETIRKQVKSPEFLAGSRYQNY